MNKDLLNAWASKAVCFHSQRTAEKLWRELIPSLTRSERDALLCAWSHARIGEKDEVFWVRDQVLRGRQAQ